MALVGNITIEELGLFYFQQEITRFLQSFNLATILHFQSEGIDKISSTWLKQTFFFYSKEINKMLKSSLDGHTFLD
jgi:hypothetical protein